MGTATTARPGAAGELGGLVPLAERPEYAAAAARLEELRGERAALAGALAAARQGPARSPLEEEARALLAGQAPPEDARTERERLERRAQVLGLAIRQAEQSLLELTARLTRAALAEVRPGYERTHLAAVVAAVKALDAALAAEADFRRRLALLGYEAGGVHELNLQGLLPSQALGRFRHAAMRCGIQV